MRIIWILSFLVISLFAIEIEIKPTKTLAKVDYREAEIFRDWLRKLYRFHISNDGAYKIIAENRLLANEYIKKYGLKDDDKRMLKLQTERYLAEKFVRLFQNEHIIDDKVALSYYLDHQDQFKKEGRIKPILFIFNDADQAIKFYSLAKGKTEQEVMKIAKEMNATIKKDDWRDIDTLKSPTLNFVKRFGKKGYMLPPEFITPSSANVLYIEDYQKSQGYKPFESVKEDIKKYLFLQTFNKFRKKLLAQYKKNEQ